MLNLRSSRILGVAACALAVSLGARAAEEEAAADVETRLGFIPEVVATYGDEGKITGTDVKAIMLPRIKQRPDGGGDIPDSALRQWAFSLTQGLLEQKVLLACAVKDGYEPKREEGLKELEAMKEKMGPEEYEQAVKMDGLSLDSLADRVAETILINRWIGEKVVGDTAVSEEQARAFYDENAERFTRPEEYSCSHILVGVDQNASAEDKQAARDKIDLIREKLTEEKADFAELAKEYSDCPSKMRGGDLGFTSPGRMVKPFEDAARKLKQGEISDVVETQFGLHIIKGGETREGGKIEFEQIKERLMADLGRQEGGKRFTEFKDKAMDAADAKILITEE